MGFLSTLILACALAMDATAVAVGARAAGGSRGWRAAWRLGFHFGLFQFLMPVVGGLAGRAVLPLIEALDHWVAFVLLVLIGGRMIREGWAGPAEEQSFDPSRGWSLIMLSIATSIDALAAGLGLAMLGADIWLTAAIIGVVTFLLSMTGFWLGARLGTVFGSRMNMAGGVVLIGIGVRILVVHLVTS